MVSTVREGNYILTLSRSCHKYRLTWHWLFPPSVLAVLCSLSTKPQIMPVSAGLTLRRNPFVLSVPPPICLQSKTYLFSQFPSSEKSSSTNINFEFSFPEILPDPLSVSNDEYIDCKYWCLHWLLFLFSHLPERVKYLSNGSMGF